MNWWEKFTQISFIVKLFSTSIQCPFLRRFLGWQNFTAWGSTTCIFMLFLIPELSLRGFKSLVFSAFFSTLQFRRTVSSFPLLEEESSKQTDSSADKHDCELLGKGFILLVYFLLFSFCHGPTSPLLFLWVLPSACKLSCICFWSSLFKLWCVLFCEFSFFMQAFCQWIQLIRVFAHGFSFGHLLVSWTRTVAFNFGLLLFAVMQYW